jgi:hypothetical protein
MNTLQLSSSCDLVIDSSGNIAVATGGSAIAQDVASAVGTFLGEVYYDTTIGVPYFSQIFGQPFSASIASTLLQNAALQVPGVVSAKVIIDSFVNRVLSGRVEVIDTTGQAIGVTF